jgi:hypothetical protein
MTTEELKFGFDIVFTVTDYQDGPRKGIANYRGEPHFYECIFNDARDGYSDSFRLTPLDTELFQLAMEDWEIWRRWETAFHSQKTDRSSHPALPREANRHAELKRIIDRLLVTDPRKVFVKVGRFEVLGTSTLPKSAPQRLQVEWTEPPPDA